MMTEEKKEAILNFLNYLKDRLEIGQSIPSILDNYIRNFAPKIIKKDLNNIKNMLEKGWTLGEALYKQKFINSLQLSIIDSGKNTDIALERIIESFEAQKGMISIFILSAFKLQMSFLLIISIGLNTDMVQKIILMSAVNREKAMTHIPFYYQDGSYFLFIGIALEIILLAFFLYYFTNRNSNTYYIYKIDKVAQYNDGIFIFSMLKSLIETGNSLQDGFLRLYKNTKNKSLKKMYKNIYNSFEKGEVKIVYFFKKTGFNSFVWERLEAIEQGGNVLKNLESAIELLKKEKNKQLKKYEKFYTNVVMFINMFIIGYISIDLTAHMMDAMLDI